MKRYLALTALLPTLLLLLFLAACGSRAEELPPPDLTGVWLQDGWEKSDYYQFAIIGEEKILIYWYKPSARSVDLYWAGTYTSPDTGKKPWKWVSETLRDERPEANRFTLVDETKPFLYKNEELTYDVMMSHMKMGVTMTRFEDLDAEAADKGIPKVFLENSQLVLEAKVSAEPEPSAEPEAPAEPTLEIPLELPGTNGTPGAYPSIRITEGQRIPPSPPPNQLP